MLALVNTYAMIYYIMKHKKDFHRFKESKAFPSSHHEFLHADWERGRVKQNLAILWHEADDIFNQDHKILGQQLIGLKEFLLKDRVSKQKNL